MDDDALDDEPILVVQAQDEQLGNLPRWMNI
jgi:hypothetical protein